MTHFLPGNKTNLKRNRSVLVDDIETNSWKLLPNVKKILRNKFELSQKFTLSIRCKNDQ